MGEGRGGTSQPVSGEGIDGEPTCLVLNRLSTLAPLQLNISQRFAWRMSVTTANHQPLGALFEYNSGTERWASRSGGKNGYR